MKRSLFKSAPLPFALAPLDSDFPATLPAQRGKLPVRGDLANDVDAAKFELVAQNQFGRVISLADREPPPHYLRIAKNGGTARQEWLYCPGAAGDG